jgi:hypothetical protein
MSSVVSGLKSMYHRALTGIIPFALHTAHLCPNCDAPPSSFTPTTSDSSCLPLATDVRNTTIVRRHLLGVWNVNIVERNARPRGLAHIGKAANSGSTMSNSGPLLTVNYVSHTLQLLK